MFPGFLEVGGFEPLRVATPENGTVESSISQVKCRFTGPWIYLFSSRATDMYRRIGCAVSILLIIFAGCGSLSADQENVTDPVTPAPLPSDTPEAKSIAPGVTSNGVEDPNALIAAHMALIENQSYTLVVRQSITERNGSQHRGLNARVALDENRSYRMQLVLEGMETNRSVWPPPKDEIQTWRYWVNFYLFGSSVEGELREWFQSVDTQVADIDHPDKVDLISITGTRFENQGGIVGGANRSIENIDFRAVITERGLIQEIEVSYVRIRHGELEYVSESIRFTAVGNTTVADPGWEISRLPGDRD